MRKIAMNSASQNRVDGAISCSGMVNVPLHIYPRHRVGDFSYRLVRSLRRITVPNLLRNVLALLAGIVIGGGINMALIILSPSLIPPPAGVDVTNAESLGKAMHLFEPQHFVMPFLAHAIGTLAGALTAYLIAGSYKAHIAYVIGALYLCGGVAASFMIPAPTWFIVLDLLAAYLPMAWLGIQIGARMKRGSSGTLKKEA